MSQAARKSPQAHRDSSGARRSRDDPKQLRQTPRAVDVTTSRLGNWATSNLIAGAGTPLPPALRAEMETRFGESFASVRIHDDASAHDSAEHLEANAYAVGNRVVFNAGRFAPHSLDGKRLLAHELAHVIQQRRGGATPSPAGEPMLEAHADQAAGRVSAGLPAQVSGNSAPGVQRDPDQKKKRKNNRPARRSNSAEDADFEGDSDHAERKTDKKRSQDRERERKVAGKSHRQIAADEADKELNRLEKQAQAPGANQQSPQRHDRRLKKFQRVLPAARGSQLDKNLRTGDLDESQRTPSGAPRQGQYVAGGPKLPQQDLTDERGRVVSHARPDYSFYRRKQDGTIERVHVNLKSHSVDQMTEGEARAAAREILYQAVRNQRHLPPGEKLIIDFGRAASPAIQEVFKHELFREGPDTPISEIRFGPVVHRESEYPKNGRDPLDTDRGARRDRLAVEKKAALKKAKADKKRQKDDEARAKKLDAQYKASQSKKANDAPAIGKKKKKKQEKAPAPAKKKQDKAAAPRQKKGDEAAAAKRKKPVDAAAAKKKKKDDDAAGKKAPANAPPAKKAATRTRAKKTDTAVPAKNAPAKTTPKKTGAKSPATKTDVDTQSKKSEVDSRVKKTAATPAKKSSKKAATKKSDPKAPAKKPGRRPTAKQAGTKTSEKKGGAKAPAQKSDTTKPPKKAGTKPPAKKNKPAPKPDTPPPAKKEVTPTVAPPPKVAKKRDTKPAPKTAPKTAPKQETPPDEAPKQVTPPSKSKLTRRASPKIAGKVTSKMFHKDQVRVDVEEYVGEAKPFRVTTTFSVTVGGEISAQAQRGGASGGAEIGASGTITVASTTSMTEAQKDQYLADVAAGRGGSSRELTIVELIAHGRTNEAANALRQAKSMFDDRQQGKVGDVEEIGLEGDISAGASAGGQGNKGKGASLDAHAQFSKGKGVRRTRTLLPDGRELYTVYILDRSSQSIGGAAGYGVASASYNDARSESNVAHRSFALDPHADDYSKRKSEILIRATGLSCNGSTRSPTPMAREKTRTNRRSAPFRRPYSVSESTSTRA